MLRDDVKTSNKGILAELITKKNTFLFNTIVGIDKEKFHVNNAYLRALLKLHMLLCIQICFIGCITPFPISRHDMHSL